MNRILARQRHNLNVLWNLHALTLKWNSDEFLLELVKQHPVFHRKIPVFLRYLIFFFYFKRRTVNKLNALRNPCSLRHIIGNKEHILLYTLNSLWNLKTFLLGWPKRQLLL